MRNVFYEGIEKRGVYNTLIFSSSTNFGRLPFEILHA